MTNDDPIGEKLNEMGIPVERRDASPIEQIVAGGLGGMAGQLLGNALGFGVIGRSLFSIGGSIVGHLVVTHRVAERPRPAADGR
jgi:hypothetical protein